MRRRPVLGIQCRVCGYMGCFALVTYKNIILDGTIVSHLLTCSIRRVYHILDQSYEMLRIGQCLDCSFQAQLGCCSHLHLGQCEQHVSGG
jgi:hypothetical protein